MKEHDPSHMSFLWLHWYSLRSFLTSTLFPANQTAHPRNLIQNSGMMSALLLLSLLFSIAAANLGQYRNFTHTCESIYSYGDEHRNIKAVCSRDAINSNLDMNDCIGNFQGQLVVGLQ